MSLRKDEIEQDGRHQPDQRCGEQKRADGRSVPTSFVQAGHEVRNEHGEAEGDGDLQDGGEPGLHLVDCRRRVGRNGAAVAAAVR